MMGVVAATWDTVERIARKLCAYQIVVGMVRAILMPKLVQVNARVNWVLPGSIAIFQSATAKNA